MKLSLLISVLLFSFTASAAIIDEKDKRLHTEAFFIIDMLAYNVARNLNSEHPVIHAWVAANAIGIVKEAWFDPSKLNRVPTDFDPRDVLYNFYGSTLAAIVQLGFEHVEKRYGINPIVILINPDAKSLYVGISRRF